MRDFTHLISSIRDGQVDRATHGPGRSRRRTERKVKNRVKRDRGNDAQQFYHLHKQRGKKLLAEIQKAPKKQSFIVQPMNRRINRFSISKVIHFLFFIRT